MVGLSEGKVWVWMGATTRLDPPAVELSGDPFPEWGGAERLSCPSRAIPMATVVGFSNGYIGP